MRLAVWPTEARPGLRIYGKAHLRRGRSFGSLPQLPRPVDRIDVDAERIGAEPLRVTRWLHDDGEDGGPSLGRCELAVLVAPLGPGHAETVGRGPDDARDVDRDLLLADLGEGVVGARVVVQGRGAAIGCEVVGAKPVLPDNDRIGRDGADLLDEARKMERDLGIGRAIVCNGGRDRLRLAEIVDLHHPGHDGAARRLPDKRCGKSSGQEQAAERHEAPVPRLHARRADALVPNLRGALVGRLGLGCLAVVRGGSLELHWSRRERLTELPPPWLSLLRIACAAAMTP